MSSPLPAPGDDVTTEKERSDIASPDVASPEIESVDVESASVGLKQRILTIVRSWRNWRSLRTRYRLLALLFGFGFVFVIAAYSISTSPAVAPAAPEPKKLSSAKRFDQIFEQLSKSDETIARLDAFVITDAMLRKLTTIDRLTTIQVKTDSVILPTIEKLSQMPKLEQLHIRGASVDDAMLAELAKSSSIWLLNLPSADVSPEAVEGLGKMPALRQLRLGIKGGDNRHGRAISTLSRLRSVHLIGVAITDEGLRPLSEMPQLESLYLDDTAVTDTGWEWLIQENTHLHIHVDQKHHDRDPQKH